MYNIQADKPDRSAHLMHHDTDTGGIHRPRERVAQSCQASPGTTGWAMSPRGHHLIILVCAKGCSPQQDPSIVKTPAALMPAYATNDLGAERAKAHVVPFMRFVSNLACDKDTHKGPGALGGDFLRVLTQRLARQVTFEVFEERVAGCKLLPAAAAFASILSALTALISCSA